MALSDASLPFDPAGESPTQTPGRKGDLTPIGEVLAASGLPVADTLKERMLEELVRLTREEADLTTTEQQRRCSA